MWTDDQIDDYFGACMTELELAQAELEKSHRLGHHERWDFDVPNQSLVFSDGGKAQVSYGISLICSTKASDGTLQWAWANKSLPAPLTAESAALKALTAETGLEIFEMPFWKGEEREAWEMTAIALKRLGGVGAYRCPMGETSLFVLLKTVTPCA